MKKYKKIIASDIDGTLLPFGQMELDEKVFELIKRLKEKDILFVPASGRSIHQLDKLFYPIKDECSFLSENGGVVWFEHEDIAETPFPQPLFREVADYVYNHPNLEGYITSATKQYIYAKDPKHKEMLHNYFIGKNTLIIDSLDEIKDTPVKVTAFVFPDGINEIEEVKESDSLPYFDSLRAKFQDRMEVMMAGPHVVDFGLANKGIGLEVLTEYLELTPDDVYAFGDNYNDLAMLEYATNSYMVTTDDPERRKAAKFMTDDPVAEIERICEEY